MTKYIFIIHTNIIYMMLFHYKTHFHNSHKYHTHDAFLWQNIFLQSIQISYHLPWAKNYTDIIKYPALRLTQSYSTYFTKIYIHTRGKSCDQSLWDYYGGALSYQSGLCNSFNSFRPSDATWQQWSWTTLARVMACCLTAPSHYLNQCWLIIRGVPWHSSENSFAGIAQGINSGYEFGKDILKIIFKSLRGQWVDMSHTCTTSNTHTNQTVSFY